MSNKRKARSSKRILASLLTGCMVLTAVPFGAFTALAEGNTLDPNRPTASNQLSKYILPESVLLSGSEAAKDWTKGEGPTQIFDGNPATKGGIQYDADHPATLTWQTSEPVILEYYTLATPGDGEGKRDPSAWTLYGSNTGGDDYVAIDAQTEVPMTVARDAYYDQDFEVASPAAYSYYKLVITGYHEPPFNHCQFSEFVMSGKLPEAAVTDPVLHYTFDDGAKDVSGNGYDGTLYANDMGNGDQNVSIANGVAEFNGQNKGPKIKLPLEAVKQKNITITMMVNATDYGANNGGAIADNQWANIFAAGDFDGEPSKYVTVQPYAYETDVCVRYNTKVDGGNKERPYRTIGTLPVGGWHQLTVTIDSDTQTLATYIDGEKMAERVDERGEFTSEILSLANLNDNSEAFLGGPAHNWEGDPTFHGKISDFRIYNRAISGDEVSAVYAENMKEFEVPALPEPEISNLKAHYDFNSDSHQVMDTTGNYNALAVGNEVVLDNGMAIFRGMRKTGLIDLPVDAFRSENLTLTTMVYADSVEDWGSILEASRPDEGPDDNKTKYQVLKWMPKTGNNNNGCISMTVRGPEGNERRVADQTTQMPVKQWVQLSYVQEGNQATLYMNGQKLETYYVDNDVKTEETSTTFSPADLTDGHRVTLGGGRYWDDPAFNGAMADFQIYDRALTAEEIGEITAYNLASNDAKSTEIRKNPNALVDIDLDNIIGKSMPNGGTGGRVLDGKVSDKEHRMTYGNGMYYTNRDTEWGTGMTFTQEARTELTQKVKTINVMVSPERGDTWGKIWDVGRNEWSGKREYVRMSWNQDYKGGKALRVSMQLCDKGATAVRETIYHAVDGEGNPLNLAVDQWYMITFTMDESGFALYINGQPVAMEKEVKTGDAFDGGTFATLLDNPEFSFGGTASDFQEGFEGWYSHVSMYEKVLNAEEVANLYTTMPIKTFEDKVKAYTYGVYFDNNDLNQTYEGTPWMNGLTVGEWMVNTQAMNDTLRYYYANGQRLESKMNGPMRRLAKQGEDGSHGPGQEFDGYPGQVANLNAPSYWNQKDRLWANMSVPFKGVAFGNNSYFTQLGTRYALTDNFVVDGKRYMVYWDSMASFDDSIEKVQKKYLQVGTELIDNKDLYPGSGLEETAQKNAFRYVYAMYNYANRAANMDQSKYMGYPMDNVSVADTVSYQAYKSADGINYIAAKTDDLAAAFDMAKGTAQNIYIITGDMARALESLGDDAAAGFALTGAPAAEAVTENGVTTQKFEKGTMYAVEGSYKFFTTEDLADVTEVEEKIDAAGDIENIATLEDLKGKIAEAQAAYDALDDATLQGMVSNYASIEALNENVAKVEAVETQIGALPEAATIVDTETAEAADPDVKSAEAALAALGDYKKYVTSTEKVEGLRTEINKYLISAEVKAVEEMIDAIGELPEENAYKVAPKVWAAKNAYDALSSENQGKVDGAKKTLLDDAVAAMEALKANYDGSKISDTPVKWTDEGLDQTPWMVASKHQTDESKQVVYDAMRDEAAFQYAHEGYDMGYVTASPKGVQVQEGLLIVELGDGSNGGDNIAGANPWYPEPFNQKDRKWAAVVAPYDGVAFSVKSPFGFFGMANQMLLGNVFEYNGKAYQLAGNGYVSYDLTLIPEEMYSWDYNNDIKGNAEREKAIDDLRNAVMSSRVDQYPGRGDDGTDVTNNTFKYAAALYNQKVKWDGKTLGIPTGNTETSGSAVYQAYEGPNGEAYIVGSASAINKAKKDVPAEVAYVLNGSELEAVKAQGATMAEALAVTGAPTEAKPESGAWQFENGEIENGVFKAYTPVEIVEKLIEKVSIAEITNKEERANVGDAYETAKAAYDALTEPEQGEVKNAGNLEKAAEAMTTFDKREKEAKEMSDRLTALPYEIKYIDDAAREAIAQARVDYENLEPITKSLVTQQSVGYLGEAEDAVIAADFTVLYKKVPADYQTAWAELDPETYLESDEYTTYIAPLKAAYEALTDFQKGLVKDYDPDMLGLAKEAIDWRPIPEEEIIEGDVNRDGKVNITDVMEMCRMLARKTPGMEYTKEELAAADLNHDNTVTITDVMMLCKVLASREQK